MFVYRLTIESSTIECKSLILWPPDANLLPMKSWERSTIYSSWSSFDASHVSTFSKSNDSKNPSSFHVLQVRIQPSLGRWKRIRQRLIKLLIIQCHSYYILRSFARYFLVLLNIFSWIIIKKYTNKIMKMSWLVVLLLILDS